MSEFVKIAFAPIAAPKGGALVVFVGADLKPAPARRALLGEAARDRIRRAKTVGFKGKSLERARYPSARRARGRAAAGRRRRARQGRQAARFRHARRLRVRQARRGQDGRRRPSKRRRASGTPARPPISRSASGCGPIVSTNTRRKKTDGEDDEKPAPVADDRRRRPGRGRAPPSRRARRSPRASSSPAPSSTSRRTCCFPKPSPSARASLEKLGVEVEVLDEKAMAKLGMGALLGVGQGSQRDSRLVVMRWRGAQVEEGQAGRVRRQGRLLRLRRHLDQARRRHGGHEGRHGAARPASSG